MAEKGLILLVPRAGLEPACGCPRWILSPLRLPFRHLGRSKSAALDATLRKILPERYALGQAGGQNPHPDPFLREGSLRSVVEPARGRQER